MAKLIRVHLDHNNQEIVINADRIIYADVTSRPNAPGYTNVFLTDEKVFMIRETLDELIGFSA